MPTRSLLHANMHALIKTIFARCPAYCPSDATMYREKRCVGRLGHDGLHYSSTGSYGFWWTDTGKMYLHDDLVLAAQRGYRHRKELP